MRYKKADEALLPRAGVGLAWGLVHLTTVDVT